ncbi:MAG: class I SAM-dependent methyltransferase [Asgard group archaeon]|nr:class I SAM-dependent methyltransferase [Asgard group archaeon]
MVTIIQDAQELPFIDNSIDRIISITCLPEIPDKIKALTEWKRVLKPNGIISLSELYGNPDYPLRRKEKEWAKLASLKLIDEFGTFLVYLLNFTKTD